MSNLTFKLKPNDEVTLKDNLHDYVARICGNLIVQTKLRFHKKDASQDPQYIAMYDDLQLFRSKTVVIEFTIFKWRYNKYDQLIGQYWYINVRDKAGNRAEFPIEFISKSYALRRDHKRYKLHNKTLVCE